MAEYPTKICSGPCGSELPIRAFAKRTASKDGHQAYCRECMFHYRRTPVQPVRRRRKPADTHRVKQRCPSCIGHKTAQLLHHNGATDFVRCPHCRGEGWVWAETSTSSPS